MANKLPDSGPISMLDIYNVLNPPIDPKECDYYFETIEDFNSRRDGIIAENNNDLSQKTFGFGDGVTSLSDGFNTTKIISTPKMIVAKNITNFRMCFDSCYSLATIQPGLFDNCPNVIDFSYCFRNAYSLTTIPSDLFDNCLSITNLNVCFANCRRLTTIPQGLFDDCPNVTKFDGCFYKCTSLTTIPSDLFDKCPKVNDFTDCFYECIEITSAIPDAWNREKFPKVSMYSGYAEGCTKAANYNEIPSKFGGPSTNPPVTLSKNTINNTKSLVNNIRTVNIPTSPISLNDTDFRELAGISNGQISLRDFYGKSTELQPEDCDYYFETLEDFLARRDAIIAENNNDLSQKTFGFGDDITELYRPFERTNVISTPKTIFGRNITGIYWCFSECSNLTTITPSLFDNCFNVIEFTGCFNECFKLITVPYNLFDNCSNATDFQRCFRFCSNISSSLPDVWNKTKFPKVTKGLEYAYECQKAANYNEIPNNFKLFGVSSN